MTVTGAVAVHALAVADVARPQARPPPSTCPRECRLGPWRTPACTTPRTGAKAAFRERWLKHCLQNLIGACWMSRSTSTGTPKVRTPLEGFGMSPRSISRGR
jgi:hypothetical protein